MSYKILLYYWNHSNALAGFSIINFYNYKEISNNKYIYNYIETSTMITILK